MKASLATTATFALFGTLFASAFQPTAAAAPQRIGCIWDREADSPIPRFEPGTLAIDGKMYCFGGFFNNQIQATTRVDSYDPLTDAWTQMASMPSPTTHIGIVREGRNVWVIGGFKGDNPAPATDEVWIYNIDSDTWSAGPTLPRPIAAGGATFIGTEVHYFGGCEADRQTVTTDHWAYDLNAPGLGWQARAAMPQARCHLSGATLGGEAWAIGGQEGHDLFSIDTRWVHAYDPGTDTWRQGPLLPFPRSHFEPGTFIDNGILYISGGKNLNEGRNALPGMLSLDPVLGEWTFLPPLPAARYGAGVQKIGSRIYASAGSNAINQPQDDLYSRDFAATFPNPLRINCGGPEVTTANGGCCWCGDIGAENGQTAFFNPQAPVDGTLEDEVFHRMREASFPDYQDVDYRLPLGDGFYRVKFFLAERTQAAPGQRILDLSIEGVQVAEGIDMIVDAGFSTALEEGFDVEVIDSVLNIKIHAQPNQRPIIAALEIEKLGPDHFAYECGNGPNSTGSPGLVDFVGSSSVALNSLTLTASPLPNNAFGLFIQGQVAGTGQLPGGTLCIQQPVFRLPIEQSQSGVMSHDLDIVNPPTAAQQIMAGTTWRFQAWHRDTTMSGYSLTNALKMVFTP